MGSGMSRATLGKKLRRCAKPAPVTANETFAGDGDFVITVKGLLIHGDTTLVIVPLVNDPGTQIAITAKGVSPSAKDVLGSVVTDITVSDANDGELFLMFLIGPCRTRVFVGTLEIAFPPPP